ncbi:MAG: putative lipid II flippase FtsW [Saccharospirillum sp.]|nr:putative lipid II flippase FtsW [Saccharospirillum sp.]
MTAHVGLPLLNDRMSDAFQPLWHFDRWLMGSALALVFIGVIMIASASIDVSQQRFGVPYHYLIRHLVYLVLGVAMVAVMAVVPMRLWQSVSWLLLFGAMALLVLVLIPGIGREVKGSWRWISLGPVGFQPSEVGKLALILYVGAYLVRRRDEVVSKLSGFLKPLLVMSVMLFLLLIQPDFGTVVVVMGTVLGMLFLGGVRAAHFFLALIIASVAVVFMAFNQSYRVQRLLSFMDPWAPENVYGSGYQLTQSLIAFGRGEWIGVGLGNSMQKLFYLPEAHNDFILAIIGEELGLIGVLTILTLFSILISRMFFVGRLAEKKGYLFGAFVSYGIAILFAIQVFINVGVNTGLLPTKGLTLPFVSAGGTSLLMCMAMVALVNRVYGEALQLSAQRRS